jgi:Putative DNA-binding domain
MRRAAPGQSARSRVRSEVNLNSVQPDIAEPSLEQVQRLFWAAITYPTGVDDFLNQAASEERAWVAQFVTHNTNFGQRARLSVYADAYFFRIREVLAQIFPVVHWLLGAPLFHNLVTDYLLASPSKSPNIHHVGDALPEYIATQWPNELAPAAADLARIELELSRCLDAADGTPLAVTALANVAPDAWEALRFHFAPSVSVVRGKHNLRVFTEAMQENRRPEPPYANRESHLTLVWRQMYTPFFRWLLPAEGQTLAALLAGQTFGEACEAASLCQGTPEDVARFIARWMNDGLIVRVG